MLFTECFCRKAHKNTADTNRVLAAIDNNRQFDQDFATKAKLVKMPAMR